MCEPLKGAKINLKGNFLPKKGVVFTEARVKSAVEGALGELIGADRDEREYLINVFKKWFGDAIE